jgi:glycosyltransferase involved in cell wall biosynthesis
MVAWPVKLFEYMAAGLPVVASNFPLWKEIVEGNRCGITVDPLDPKAIAQAIEYLLAHPEEARQMGENGRRAVEEKYNWEKEAEKLLALYKELVDSAKGG